MNSGGLLLGVDRLDRGGLERVVASLALGLQRLGKSVAVLCWREGGHTARELARAGVRVHMAHGRRDVVGRVLESERPRALGSHWVDLAVLEAATERGIPTLEHVHNSYIWLDNLGWARERERSRHFTRALAVSELTRRYYLHWNVGFDPARIGLLGNGVAPENARAQAHADARARLRLAPDDFLIVSLGGYDGIKNQLGLLAAFEDVVRRHPQARLMCAGAVTNREYFALVRRAARQSLHRQHIVISQYRRDARTWLEGADLCVVASFAEGWSLAATEALMEGTPLVHTDSGGALELVGDGARGVRVPNPAGDPLTLDRERFLTMMREREQPNRAELAEAMSRMIETRSEWRERREAIARQARHQFSAQTMIEGYLDALHEVAGSGI
jgi:glycosyltransferase involved in cell wall biosynthesis